MNEGLYNPMMRRLSVALLFVVLFISACSSPEGTPAAINPTATLLPVLSRTPRSTSTPESSRTPLPTFTFTPTVTQTLAPPTDTPTPTLTPTIVGIINSLKSVNVREGPGTQYRALWALNPGTGVLVLGQSSDGEWINIRMENNDEGWISARLLFVEDTPPSANTETPTPDMTKLFNSTPLPTAILGQGSPTATPPSVLRTPDAEAINPPTATQSDDLPVIDIDSINATATALSGGVFEPTARASEAVTEVAEAEVTATDSNTFVTPTLSTNPQDFPSVTPVGPTAQPTQTRVPIKGIRVFAYCNNPKFNLKAPTNIKAGDYIEIYWAWFSRTDQQLIDHLENVNMELEINGEPITIEDDFISPAISVGGDKAVYFYIPYGPLEAGDYLITYQGTWDKAITDGYAQYGPGTENTLEEESCQINVKPAP